jgi:hypothetical protein
MMLTMAAIATPTLADEKDSRVYELRIYWAPPGKLDALHARFRDHTLKLFTKHGMTNLGYWVPVKNTDERLIYLLAHKSREAADQSWKAFIADEDWKKAHRESEVDGKLVAKIERVYMSATDYGRWSEGAQAGTGRTFELRTYITPPDRRTALDRRFRDHTLNFFTKYGMTNVAYWHPLPDDKLTVGKLLKATTATSDDKIGAEPTTNAPPISLIYLLAHASPEARDKAFAGFRNDPAWITAKQASEDQAGGSLTVADGFKSLLLKPTDYSPIK